MVNDRAIESLGDDREPACASPIGVTGLRISARVIVREDDACAAQPCDIRDNRSQREERACFITGVARDVDAVHLLVDVSDKQAFT